MPTAIELNILENLDELDEHRDKLEGTNLTKGVKIQQLPVHPNPDVSSKVIK